VGWILLYGGKWLYYNIMGRAKKDFAYYSVSLFGRVFSGIYPTEKKITPPLIDYEQVKRPVLTKGLQDVGMFYSFMGGRMTACKSNIMELSCKWSWKTVRKW
jgi:hypothetical protein